MRLATKKYKQINSWKEICFSITDADTIATDNQTVTGNYSLSFIPNSTTASIHFGANSAVALHTIQISYHHIDTLISQPRRGGYRYGAFGFEKDDEVKGSGNHYAFADYGYDPRLVRRWQIDPLANAFPWQSPYSAFNNNPIFFTDPTGESGVASITDQKNKDGKPIMKVVSNVYIYGAGATDANAKTMQGNAMAQYNNNGNYFTATVDGVEYEVQFDIKVQVMDAKDVENKLLPGGYETLNAENNFYEMVDNPKVANNLGVTLSGEDREGSRGGSTGFIKTSEAGTPTLSHELNHGYGGTNKDLPDGDETKLIDNDISVQDKNSTDPSSRKVTQGNIDAIFKNVDFKGGKTANVGNPRPQLYDNTTGKSKSVSPK